MPKVSVIVPNYNYARFLRRRLDSIMEQTFGDFEVIILDDASTDGSQDVIRLYLADLRVSFHPKEANSGSPFFQWNRGVQLARGDYVWIAESDDYAEKEFLATLVPILEEHPQVGLAYCQSWRVDDQGNWNRNQKTAWLGIRLRNPKSILNARARKCSSTCLLFAGRCLT